MEQQTLAARFTCFCFIPHLLHQDKKKTAEVTFEQQGAAYPLINLFSVIDMTLCDNKKTENWTVKLIPNTIYLIQEFPVKNYFK